jgi:hypothetical protein
MNIIKHYTGILDEDGDARHYYIKKDGTLSNVQHNTFYNGNGYGTVKYEKIIGTCLEDILKIAGFSNAKYFDYIDDTPVSYLCLDTTSPGFNGFYIIWDPHREIAYGYCDMSDPTDNVIYINRHHANGIAGMASRFDQWFNGDTYDGYLKLVGSINSGFEIIPSSQGRAAMFDFSQTCSLFIANLINKLDNKESIYYRFTSCNHWDDKRHNNGNGFGFLVDKNTNIGNPGDNIRINAIPMSGFYLPYEPMGSSDNIPLIQAHISTYPNMFFKDGYFKPDIFEDATFYEINGDTYYTYSNMMFKC